MDNPISQELNIRERIERLFISSSDRFDIQLATSQLEEATERLSAAIASYLPIDCNLSVPVVRIWSPEDGDIRGDDLMVLQLARSSTGTKFRVFLTPVLAELFVRLSFGSPSTGSAPDFDCGTSDFCKFFVSDVSLTAIRFLVTRINGSRPQSILFEQFVETNATKTPDLLREAGVLATWLLTIMDVPHKICAYVPQSEFKQLAKPAQDDADAQGVTDSSGADWALRMKSSLYGTELQLRAVMTRADMLLEALSDLKVGDVIEFAETTKASIILECEGEPIYRGEVGRKGGRFAVHLTDDVRGEDRFFSDANS